jgi:hypothetical protein
MTHITKLKLLPRSTMKAKAVTRLVGQVTAGDGITVTKTAGNFAVALSAGVVQSVVDDTNVTGDVSSGVLTLGWAGTLGLDRGGVGTGTAGHALMGSGAGVASSYLGYVPTGPGATVRTWQSKADDFLNAKDFGVLANGVADDTAGFQAAVDAAAILRRTVVLPGGDLNIVTGGITIPAYCRIVGQGASLTTLAINHASNTTFNVSSDGFSISDLTITNFVARTASAKTFNITAGASTYTGIRINGPGTAFHIDAGTSSIILLDDVHISDTVAGGVDWDVYNALILSVNNCTSSGDSNPANRSLAHFRVTHCEGQIQLNNTHCFQAQYGLYSTPGEDQVVTLFTGVASSFDSNSIAPIWVVPTAAVGAGADGQFHRFLWDSGWLGGGTGYVNFSAAAAGTVISEIQITKNKLFPNVAGGVVANFTNVDNVTFSDNQIFNVSGDYGASFDGVAGGDVSGNHFLAAHAIGFFVTNTTDYLQIHHHNFLAPLITTPISDSSSGTNNRFHDNIGLADTPPLPATSGGTGLAALGAGVATWLGTPSSANLAAAVTGETGTGALVFGTAPALFGPATLTYSPGAGAGSGNRLGLGFTATRSATSVGTDTFNVIDISFTDSGSVSTTQTAALSFTSTYSNANNTSTFNLGVKAYAQTSQNLTKYSAFYAGATLFGGALGTYSAFYAQAPAAAGGTVTAKFTLNGEASAGLAFNSDGFATAAPVTKTGTSSTVADTEPSVIFNASGTHTVTLPAASGVNTGKILRFKSRAAQAVNSASSNVKPIDTDTAGTAILTATAGKWAILQSDGTNWVIMASN